jgi:bacteriocin biosynthesis cyclodehydratase domain-containing protein
LLPLWRDRDTVQIGVDPRRAVALTGVGAASAVIGLLDGSRDRGQVVTAASELGIPVAVTERIMTLLAAAGVLVDFPGGALRSLPAELRARLVPELATASLAHLDADGGAHILARRAATPVWVCGSCRLAAAITELLAASGATAASQGGRRRARPGLAVLVGRPPPELAAGLLRDRVPHLAVTASEAIGTVGPLVRPGVTACLRCLDLARADRDPAWPLILAQLASRQADPAACDVALAAAVAAQAAAQALSFIDRPARAGPAENGTLELVLPGWQWRRRTWRPHPACTCRSAEAAS